MLNTCNLIKKRTQHSNFPFCIAKPLRTPFLQNTSELLFVRFAESFSLNTQLHYGKHVNSEIGGGGLPPFPSLKKCYQLRHKFSKTFTKLKYPGQA